MKKFAFTTTAVLLGMAQWAAAAPASSAPTASAAATPPPTNTSSCCTTDGSCTNCPSPCNKGDKSIQCGEQEWLDIETVTLEAENGDPIAQYTVAYLLETDGTPGEDNSTKAHEWYSKSVSGLEKAAAEGSATACCALAHMYAEGKGVEKNPEMAAKYKKMYKELCAKKCKEWKHMKKCCPQGPGPVQPAQN